MIILSIESSCDETSAAILEGNQNRLTLLSHVVASSLDLHAKTGGVIPENAAREQLKYILPVIQEASQKAFGETADSLKKIDKIAVTYGPGLIGSLLVGVETVRTLSYVLNKPIIQVNHMMGHIYANWLEHTDIAFPALALVISGGHTDLLLLKKHGELKLLGGTRDDAAGEAFDKIGRLLGLPYPSGPVIEELAKNGNPKRFHFPRPLHDSGDFDFSFSGLKTAVLREVQSFSKLSDVDIADIARATQDAIIDILIKKTLKAAEKYHAASILLSGGVAANQTLRNAFQKTIEEANIPARLVFPSKTFCTDNAAMIASAAYFNPTYISWKDLTADPQLYYT